MFDLVERLISTSSDASLAEQDLDEPISEPISPSNTFTAFNNGGLVFGDHLRPGRQRFDSETDSGMGSVNCFYFLFFFQNHVYFTLFHRTIFFFNSQEDESNAHDRFFNHIVKKVSCIDPDGVVCRMLSSDTVSQRLEALANFEEEQTSILSQVIRICFA